MTSIFEWTEEGPVLVLNQRGEKLFLTDGTSVSFDDLVGAWVKIVRRNAEVTCEARVPESKGIFRWRFELDGNETKHLPDGSPLPPVRNLAALISECRVGLNGRL